MQQTGAQIRQLVRRIDRDRKEIEHLIPLVKGELKQKGLREAHARILALMCELIRAAG